MSHEITQIIEEIETRVCTLQTDNVSLHEGLKNAEYGAKKTLNHSILHIIDILDMLEAIQSSIDLNDENNSNARMILKKVNKRLIAFLNNGNVKEIVFEQGKFQPGEVRVLEKAASGTAQSGRIVKVCRKGYQQENKIIRPADVITAV